MVALPHVGQQPAVQAGGDLQAVRRAAEDFEAVFVGQLLGSMMEGLAKDGPLGGGDDPFAALLREEYGKLIARSGGIGVADAVLRELLRTQEAR